MGKRRKKHRTHIADDELYEKTPKSFVLRRGKLSKTVKALMEDVRSVMAPYTAEKLKVRKSNQLKDFVSVAGPLGISHFLIFSNTDLGTYLRIMKLAHGPTLYFRVKEYTLMRDILNLAPVSHPSSGSEFLSPPLIVLNNFAEGGKHIGVMAVMFQNMFPPINVQTIKIAECRRVVLLHFNKDTEEIEFRQYEVRVAPVGLSKSVKRIVQSQIPDLSRYEDVADYVMNNVSAAESEAEDGEDSKVDLSSLGHKDRRVKTAQTAVRLRELGPRMTLELMKIEEGLGAGAVLYHKYVEKTEAELAALDARKSEIQKAREARKKKQDDNIARKEALKAATREKQIAAKNRAAKGSTESKLKSQEDSDSEKDGDESSDEEGEKKSSKPVERNLVDPADLARLEQEEFAAGDDSDDDDESDEDTAAASDEEDIDNGSDIDNEGAESSESDKPESDDDDEDKAPVKKRERFSPFHRKKKAAPAGGEEKPKEKPEKSSSKSPKQKPVQGYVHKTKKQRQATALGKRKGRK